MINQLLNLAQQRVQTAQSELYRQKKKQAKALENRNACQRSINAFQQWRPEEEERLFNAIALKPCTSKEIDQFQASIAQLSQRENQLKQQLQEAIAILTDQERILDKKTVQYKNASKRLEKFKVLQSNQLEEEHKQNIIQQELEQEDRPSGISKGLL